jgi:hypothetical protein
MLNSGDLLAAEREILVLISLRNLAKERVGETLWRIVSHHKTILGIPQIPACLPHITGNDRIACRHRFLHGERREVLESLSGYKNTTTGEYGMH